MRHYPLQQDTGETHNMPENLISPEVLGKVLAIFRQIWMNFENDGEKKILPDGQILTFDLDYYRVEYRPNALDDYKLIIHSRDGNAYSGSNIPIEVAESVLRHFYGNSDLLTPTGQFWVFRDGHIVRDLSSKPYGKPASLETKRDIANQYIGPFVQRIKNLKSGDDVIRLNHDLQAMRVELLKSNPPIFEEEEVDYLIFLLGKQIAKFVSSNPSNQVYGRPISKDQYQNNLTIGIRDIILELLLNDRVKGIIEIIDRLDKKYRIATHKNRYWKRWALALGTIATLGIAYIGFDIANHSSSKKSDPVATTTCIHPRPTRKSNDTTKPISVKEKAREYQETAADRAKYIDSICDTDDDSTNNGTTRRIPKTQCEGSDIKALRDSQKVIQVPYTDYSGTEQTGYIVVHKDVADSTSSAFEQLQETGFRIKSVIPVSEFEWKDTNSMSSDNSSAFNPRCSGVDEYTADCTLSQHSYGKAIDLNPVENPFYKNGNILPKGATYVTSVMGTVTNQVVQILANNGWKNWGGSWNEKDYQHFQFKSDPT